MKPTFSSTPSILSSTLSSTFSSVLSFFSSSLFSFTIFSAFAFTLTLTFTPPTTADDDDSGSAKTCLERATKSDKSIDHAEMKKCMSYFETPPDACKTQYDDYVKKADDFNDKCSFVTGLGSRSQCKERYKKCSDILNESGEDFTDALKAEDWTVADLGTNCPSLEKDPQDILKDYEDKMSDAKGKTEEAQGELLTAFTELKKDQASLDEDKTGARKDLRNALTKNKESISKQSKRYRDQMLRFQEKQFSLESTLAEAGSKRLALVTGRSRSLLELDRACIKVHQEALAAAQKGWLTYGAALAQTSSNQGLGSTKTLAQAKNKYFNDYVVAPYKSCLKTIAEDKKTLETEHINAMKSNQDAIDRVIKQMGALQVRRQSATIRFEEEMKLLKEEEKNIKTDYEEELLAMNKRESGNNQVRMMNSGLTMKKIQSANEDINNAQNGLNYMETFRNARSSSKFTMGEVNASSMNYQRALSSIESCCGVDDDDGSSCKAFNGEKSEGLPDPVGTR